MKIQKIKQLKNFEAFDSFEWTAKNLSKYNLIYGWNGSGKTTISRIFYSLENNQIAHELGTKIDFNIRTDGKEIKVSDLDSHPAKIKVFNEDFIRDNLQFQTAKAKKILIVGKGTGDVTDEIKELETQQTIENTKYGQLKSELAKTTNLDKILTDAGGEVVKQFANTPLANGDYSGRSYNRRKVQTLLSQNVIHKGNISSLIISKQEDIDKKREIIKSDKNKVDFSPFIIDNFSDLFTDANNLLSTKVSVDSIEELEDDSELRKWVEQGFHIHTQRKIEICQFCKNSIQPDYLERLAKFFTVELEEIKRKINIKITELDKEEYKGNIKSIESNIFFPDIDAEYLSIKALAEENAVKIRASIDKLITQLIEKKENLHNKTKEYSPAVYPVDAIKAFNEASQRINRIVKDHNTQIENISEAAKDIELHAISKKLSDQKYFQEMDNINNLNSEISKIKKILEQIDSDIKTKRSSVLNASLAIGKINDVLKEFFGESHIYIDPDPDGAEVGYLLKRRGKNAKNLSEGEKSVIALMYFLTKIEEDGFDIKDSLVLIDDPVDSQDELFLFKTFGIIKRYLSKSGQLIILTHNFPFFNLVRDWFKHEKYCQKSELYLMRCIKTPTENNASISPIPDLLNKYKSEYQYLFYQLYTFREGTQSIEEPLVPNIARKILEYFAGFKWCCNVSEDFTNIVQNRYTSEQNPVSRGIADFIIKFLHEYSHGRDFSRPITASTFEAKSVAKNTLDFIKLADKDHFDKLEKLCK